MGKEIHSWLIDNYTYDMESFKSFSKMGNYLEEVHYET